MKTLKHYSFMLLALCFLLITGMKCKKDSQNPSKEQLPAATQTGANTFGFLLNGEVWLPKGGLLDQKLDLSYDPSYKRGTFNIIAKRYFDDGSFQSISISSFDISAIGTYPIAADKVTIYFNNTVSCSYHWNESSSSQNGTLVITKLDLTNKFISGTFEFKLEKNGCPTINATQGRFDMKIE
ncbi:DUF6252 family protein [Pedobacter sp. UBA4863]|uniref:DUF6252 family protein n=1 Tax=Pedobacter sp. UBA4863 TaxID=1947060 RepID=UPI0025E12989|nr:DUF6252 family protein [Pedobacter sp. UBA4863]